VDHGQSNRTVVPTLEIQNLYDPEKASIQNANSLFPKRGAHHGTVLPRTVHLFLLAGIRF
jgi:hypothetical protein